MKKLIILAVILALALMLAPAALAAGGGGGNGPGPGGAATHAHNVNYSLNGTVQAVDTSASTISVLVKQSNRRARAFKGDVVSITVTDTTKLYRRTVDGELVAITLADFAADDRVQSVGTLDKTDPAAPVFTARRITLRPVVDTARSAAADPPGQSRTGDGDGVLTRRRRRSVSAGAPCLARPGPGRRAPALATPSLTPRRRTPPRGRGSGTRR